MLTDDRWDVHVEICFLCFPSTACCNYVPERKEKVSKIHEATNTIHFFLLLPQPPRTHHVMVKSSDSEVEQLWA